MESVRVFGPVPERADQMEKNNYYASVIMGLSSLFKLLHLAL